MLKFFIEVNVMVWTFNLTILALYLSGWLRS